MERDGDLTGSEGVLDISTHALTWSATLKRERRIMANVISTHALTWSATGKKTFEVRKNDNFNSRAHVERDFGKSKSNAVMSISTHALTWSATSNRCR